jgi:hypothetical protein
LLRGSRARGQQNGRRRQNRAVESMLQWIIPLMDESCGCSKDPPGM